MASSETLQWATFADFTPGIHSASQYVLGGSAIPAPLGAAQQTNTYRCIGLPRGGLAPMPRAAQSIALPDPTDTPGGDGFFHVVGFFAFGPVGPDTPPTAYTDNLFVGVEYLHASPSRRFRYYRMDLSSSGSPTDLLATINSAVLTGTQQYQGMSFGATRIHPTTITTPGTPVVVTSWSPPSWTADRHVWAFPSPAAPTVTGLSDLAGRSGCVVVHQGRVVLLEFNVYAFGGNTADAIPTNENISFTASNAPLSSMNAAALAEVFVQEFPNGISSWGSISAGELLFIKWQGGGVLIQGDIANPVVRRLPGIVSGGGVAGMAAATPSGLFYCTLQGAYTWRGSDTATKISFQLDDNFWRHADGLNILNMNYHAVEWADWVAFSNNWIYDTVTNSWWRLEDPAVHNYIYAARGNVTQTLFTAESKYTSVTKADKIKMWDRSQPASSYSWQSHPLSQSHNRTIDVRELVLRAQGTGTITVTIKGFSGATQVLTFPVISSNTQPVRIRKNCSVQGEDITVRIEAAGDGSAKAPVVYELLVGYHETAHSGQTVF